ncbi:MAG: hypothetical protein DI565_13845 [Ancylobacter novellus]|uniref:Uncharacterized protein n=1 Tax=Ancylobacter novellus TaxID=921 RepID=A0A2W5MJJ4_ANCNO|nr:MAG: hypothetical protein DI565_13845 [Ancylobacter novellus]
MGAYAEGEPDDLLSGTKLDREVLRQKLEQMSDTLESMRRDRRKEDAAPPPVKSWYERYGGLVNVVVGIVLTALIGVTVNAQRDQADRMDRIEGLAKSALTGVDRIDKDRSARIADIDTWRARSEEEFKSWRVGYSDFRRLEGTVAELGKKLSDGRDERLRDREADRTANQAARDMIMGAIGDLKTQVALLRQEVRGRRAEDPFGGENQMWIVPPPGRPAPLILRAMLFQSSPVAVLQGGRWKDRGVRPSQAL